MVDYLNVIQVGVAMIIIIAIGFVLAKLKIINEKQSAPMNQMTFKLGMLPLVARAIAPKDLATLDFRPFGIAALMSVSTYIVVAIIIFLLPLKDRFGTFLATILPCTYINYIISGIPVFNSLWPPEENIVVSLMTIANDLITAPIYLTLVGFYNVQQNNIQRKIDGLEPEKFSIKVLGGILLNVIKSPILIGNIVGIIYAALPIGYPIFLQWALQFCGDIVFSLSLICVGVFLAQHSLMSCHWLQFIFCVFVRFFVGSIIAGLYCYAFGMSARISRQCMIIGAQPTAVASYVLSSGAHLGEGVASTLIFWTTVLTVPAIIVWFSILDGLGIYVE